MPVRFVGSQCLATASTKVLIGATSASVSLWVRLNPGCHVSAAGGTQIFGDGAGRLSILLDGSDNLHAGWFPNGVLTGGGSSWSRNLVPGASHHLAMTWQDGLQQYFFDGALIYTTNLHGSLGSVAGSTAVPFRIGSDSSGTDATVDEPAVWNGYALTAQDVANLCSKTVHQAGVSPASIVLRWTLAGPDGLTTTVGDPGLIDGSASGLNLSTVVGSAPTYQATALKLSVSGPSALVQVAPSGSAIVLTALDPSGQPSAIQSLLSVDDSQAVVLSGMPSGGQFTLSFSGHATTPLSVTAAPPVSATWTFKGLTPGANYVARVSHYQNPSYATAARFDFLDGSGTLVKGVNLDETTGITTDYTSGSAFGYLPYQTLTTLTPTGTTISIRLTGPPYNASTYSGTIQAASIQLTPAGGPSSGDPNEGPATIQQFASATVVGSWTGYGSASPSGTVTAYTVDPSAIQSALLALPNFPPGGVAVSNPSLNNYLVHFTGPLAGTPQPTLGSSDLAATVFHDGTQGSVVGGQGPSISVNGGPAVLLKQTVWGAGQPSHVFPFALYLLPRSAPATQVFHWREGVFSAGGSWTTHVATDGTAYGSIGDGSAGPVIDTATWSLQGLPPATYQLAVTFPHDSGASTSATYTVTDGSTTLATVSVDQTKTPADLIDGGIGYKVLGSFTPTGVVNQLVVSVTGSGTASATVRAGQIRLARTSADQTVTIGSTDVVTFSAPAAAVTSAAGPSPALTAAPVSNLVGGRLVPAFNPTLTRAMKVGWNLDSEAYFGFSSHYANRAFGMSSVGSLASDKDGFPTRIAGGATSAIVCMSSDDIQGDGRGVPTSPPGRWTLEWDGSCTCSLVTYDGSTLLLEDTSRQSLTGSLKNHREYLVSSAFFRGVAFRVQMNAQTANPSGGYNVDGRNLKIYPPDPADPTGATAWVNPPLFHPGLIAQLAGASCIRTMNPLGINNSNVQNFSDFPTTTRLAKFSATSTLSAPIQSIAPYTGSDVFITGLATILVTTSTAHGLSDGMIVTLTPGTTSSYQTIAIGSVVYSTGQAVNLNYFSSLIRVLSPTTFVMGLYSNGTITNTLTPASATVQAPVGDGGGIAYTDLIAMANQVNQDLWINVPHLATDACVTQMATLAAAQLKPNLKVHVEFSNEVWNYGFHQWAVAAGFSRLMRASDPTIPLDGGQPQAAWYVSRMAKAHSLFVAAFVAANRPATDVRRVMAGQIATGPLNAYISALKHFYPTDYATRFDEYAVAPYWANDPADGNSRSPSLQPLYNLMTCGQLLDLFELTAMYGNYGSWITASVTALSAGGLPGVSLVAYEGGPEQMVPNGSGLSANQLARNHAVARHPRFYWVVLKMLQNFNDAGCKLFMDFVLSGQNSTAEWPAYLYTGMPTGTGNPANDLANVSNPFNVSAIKSQTGGASKIWSAVVAATNPKRVVPGRNSPVRTRGMFRSSR